MKILRQNKSTFVIFIIRLKSEKDTWENFSVTNTLPWFLDYKRLPLISRTRLSELKFCFKFYISRSWVPVISVLASHTAEPGSNPGSGRILTWTSLVDSCQSNVTSTTIKRLTSFHSSLNVCSCYEAGDNTKMQSLSALRKLTLSRFWILSKPHCASVGG